MKKRPVEAEQGPLEFITAAVEEEREDEGALGSVSNECRGRSVGIECGCGCEVAKEEKAKAKENEKEEEEKE